MIYFSRYYNLVRKRYAVQCLILLFVDLLLLTNQLFAQLPAGFSKSVVQEKYTNQVGLIFSDDSNQAFVWKKSPNDAATQVIVDRIRATIPASGTTAPVTLTTLGTWLTYVNDPSIWVNDLTTLENATIKLQYRKSIGGVLFWASLKSNNRNLIQTHLRDGGPYWDTGRSYGGAWYASPTANTALTIDGITAFGIGYDPVWGGSINSQLGDGSEVIKAAKITDPTRGTVFCMQVRPKQWDFMNKPADMLLNHEFWLAADNTQGHRMQVIVEPRRAGVQAPNTFSGYSQEEPGVYPIANLTKRMVLVNGQDIDKYPIETTGPPQNYYTDNYAIYSGDNILNQGIMLYTPENNCMGSGQPTTNFGTVGEATDITAGYMQSKPYRNLDSPGKYELTIYTILGSYNDCKARIATLPQPSQDFDFDFSDVTNLQHGWSNGNEPWKVENGAWTLAVGQGHSDNGVTSYRGNIGSPYRRWQASGISSIAITGAVTAGTSQLQLTWQKVQPNGSLQEFSKAFPVVGDGVERTYTVPLTGDPNWTGYINHVGVQAVVGIPSNAKFIVKRIRKQDTIAPSPDLTPVFYLRPTLAIGTTNINVVVNVVEVNSIASSGLISLKINKDSRISLSFNAQANSVGNRLVNNSAWVFKEDANYYVLTTTQAITAGGVLSVGLIGTLIPGSTRGILGLSGVLVGGSGGEVRISNNVDSDKVEYFQQ